jgi:methionine-rich copper-binding protein CopC
MRYIMIAKAVKHLQPHPEEPAKRPSRRMAACSAAPVAILRDGAARLLRMRSVLSHAVFASLLLCFGLGAAHAHAFLDHADPRVGNTVKSAPRIVSLWFTQNLEGSFSTIEVFDSSGALMNIGKASVDGNDRKLLRVAVKAMPPGTYTVKWHVLSVDTHTTDGNFTFRVGP